LFFALYRESASLNAAYIFDQERGQREKSLAVLKEIWLSWRKTGEHCGNRENVRDLQNQCGRARRRRTGHCCAAENSVRDVSRHELISHTIGVTISQI